MPCFYPLKAYRARFLNPSGKRGLVFRQCDGLPLSALEVPCGQCIGCRLERSRQWAVRCVHEASLYDSNSFITLTYDPDCVPEGHSLSKLDFQLFMKRLRKRFKGFDPVVDKDGVVTFPIRYFHCGEYGERFGRPHYHACLFNFDFDDKVEWKIVNSNIYYISSTLSELWPFGFSTIGAVTFDSAAYVARYIMKKVTGEFADEHYTYIDEVTGEFFNRVPEYTTMSRRPGIGQPWLDKFLTDVYPSDFLVVNGVKMKPPKYYDRQYEILDIKGREESVRNRRIKALRRKDDNTPDRLRVRERVLKSRVSQLKRSVEDDC